MSDDYGAAQPLGDLYDRANRFLRKYLGDPQKSAGSKTSETDAGKLPKEWEEANKRSTQTKLADRKPLGSGKTTTKKTGKKPIARKR